MKESNLEIRFNWKLKRTWIFSTLRIALALGIAMILVQFPFYSLEFFSYDLRMKLSPSTRPSEQVVTVAVDRPTIDRMGHEPSALELKKVFANILREKPLAIVYLSWPFKTTGTFSELESLAQLIEQQQNLYFIADEIPMKGEEQKFVLSAPFQKAKILIGPLTHDLKNFAADDVTRRAILAYEGRTTAHTEIAQQLSGIENPYDYRGAFDFRDSPQVFIDYRAKGTYKPFSFIDISEDRVKPGQFAGKIVLIGRDAETDVGDYVRTPFSKDTLAMSRLETHANILDTLIKDTGVKKAPDWINILITCAVSIITVFAVFGMRPTRGVLALGIMTGVFIVFSYLGFALFGTWFQMTHPILAIFIPYYFFIPYRLIQEYRKRWEYQQKHTLISQVEELKTNFLSMMSHDLKTPLARIQGMADIALQYPNVPEQKEALQTIVNSTEELSLFISSILNLGRIESKELKLHKQSRDINSVLEDVIRKYQFMAKTKNIEIITELEPLFSLKVDVDLMRQVFSNLVENAIKYSHPNTKILISTEEVDNHILVQVADQGAGIPVDELNHVFMKFYRSKDAKASPIKGSGLGLYLAKYFVELHNGKITVESVANQGSTFTVDLPMDV